MDYECWINKAISKIGALPVGTEFTLRELFEGIEWNEMTSGEKKEFGRQFKAKVLRNLVPKVVHSGQAQNHSAKYKKTI